MSHKHKFTDLAPEATEGYEDAALWEWCIRCGALRLEKAIFLPGDHQFPEIMSESERAAIKKLQADAKKLKKKGKSK